MMGRHHAAFAAAAGALVPAAMIRSGEPVDGRQIVAAVVVAAGAGLFPDFDEPGSSAPRTFGWLGRAAGHLVRWVALGHRGLTHTIECVAAATAGVWLATYSPVAVGVVVGLLVAVGADAFPDVRSEWAVLVGGAAGWWASTAVGPGAWWLPASVAVGWLAHMVGDTFTPHGVPWLAYRVLLDRATWKFKLPTPEVRWRWQWFPITVRFPWRAVFTTGSPVETLVTWPLVAGLAVLAWVVSGLTYDEVLSAWHAAVSSAAG